MVEVAQIVRSSTLFHHIPVVAFIGSAVSVSIIAVDRYSTILADAVIPDTNWVDAAERLGILASIDIERILRITVVVDDDYDFKLFCEFQGVLAGMEVDPGMSLDEVIETAKLFKEDWDAIVTGDLGVPC